MTAHPNQAEILSNFGNFATKFFDLEPQTVLEICSRFQVHSFQKKTMVINFGQLYDRIYFVYSGILRGFYIEDEKEVTNWFAKENQFFYSPKGYLTKQPTEEAIETLEDSIILSLSFENLDYLYSHFPETSTISRILTEHYLHLFDRKIRLLRIQNAEKRVKKFIELYPKEFHQLPYKYVASFLGLAPETFSRIIARKN